MRIQTVRLKITIILEKDGQKSYLYPSVRKMQFFLRNKANRYFKSHYLITIRVTYGMERNVFGKTVMFENTGTYSKLGDLQWAYQVFVKEYLPEYG